MCMYAYMCVVMMGVLSVSLSKDIWVTRASSMNETKGASCMILQYITQTNPTLTHSHFHSPYVILVPNHSSP